VRGELRLVADRLIREVWLPVVEQHSDKAQVAGDLFALASECMIDRYDPEHPDSHPDKPLELRAAEASTDYELAILELASIGPDDFECEADIADVAGNAFEVLDEYEDETSSQEMRLLLHRFLERYSLRYYVDTSGRLRGTLPGLTTSAYFELRKICITDSALRPLLEDFEHALAEAIDDASEVRVKTTLSKLFMLMEGVASKHPDVRTEDERTLGRLCQRISSWPHSSVQHSAEELYRFACDYPGIRHAGSPANAKRPITTSDLAGICSILMGFTAYLVPEFPDGVGLRLHRRTRLSAEAEIGASTRW
jgi:hypothetical protein